MRSLNAPVAVLKWFRELLGWPTTSTTFRVQGRYLQDTAGNRVILRGINLPLLDDWNFPGSDTLPELEKTGANAVRIQWYVDYGNPARPAYGIQNLDAFLDKCRLNRLIPILDLHDCTCAPDPNLVNTKLIPWWTRPDVVSVLVKHQKYLIINLANELGHYRWVGATTAALDAFKNAYKSAITSTRNVGLQMPIMIDAPDCGTSIDVLTSIGQQLIDYDPEHNILLSVHAYWADLPYSGTVEITKAYHANLPVVFGEIANKQREGDDECYYDLDGTNEHHAPKPDATGATFRYQSLLTLLAQHEMGWLAWCWWKDNCADRQMTHTGKYANLTPYGNDLVNNGSYGLRLGYFHATRTPTLP